MPSFRKMSPEEIDAVEGHSVSSRKAIAELYDDLVRDLTEGDNIELELEPDERRQTVIARLKAAAARRKPALQLEFKSSDDPIVLHFLVPVVTPPPVVQPAPVPLRPAVELPDLIDDQSQSLLNLRDTRDRRDQQPRNNRYDRRDRPNTSRSRTAHVQRSNTAGRFQSSRRPSQLMNGQRNGSSPMNGQRNGSSPMNGQRNGSSPMNGQRNGSPPMNGQRNDSPSDRSPSAPFNRQRQRRRTR